MPLLICLFRGGCVNERLRRVPAREAVSDFLRQCRERLSPEAVGLPKVRRRRTKGLRREETAALAGVGLTWYTWFEQGRDIVVSDDFLNRVARALRLDRAEREHLFALSGRDIFSDGIDSNELSSSLRTMTDAFHQPAYIMNSSWDVIAFNKPSEMLFEDLKLARPNMLRTVFFSGSYRDNVFDWNFSARLVLLKARHDYLTGGRSHVLGSILSEVLNAFPQATEWWDDPEIVRIGDTDFVSRDRDGRFQRYRLLVLVPENNPRLRVIFYEKQCGAAD